MDHEGVRFAWLCFAVRCPWSGGDAEPPKPLPEAVTRPWRITGLRLVAKVQLYLSPDSESSKPIPNRIYLKR